MQYRGIEVSADYQFKFAIDEYQADKAGVHALIDDLIAKSFEHRGVFVGPTGDEADEDGNGGLGFEIAGRQYRIHVATKAAFHDIAAARETVVTLIDALLG